MALITYALALSPVLWAYTAASLSLPSAINGITCFRARQGYYTRTIVDGCRSTLNYMRTLPGYRKSEWFQRGRNPNIPATKAEARPLTPPFVWHVPQSDCILQTDTVAPGAIDRFTFERARTLATEMVEDCQAFGGFGGFAELGRAVGWQVKVMGFDWGADGLFKQEGNSSINIDVS